MAMPEARCWGPFCYCEGATILVKEFLVERLYYFLDDEVEIVATPSATTRAIPLEHRIAASSAPMVSSS